MKETSRLSIDERQEEEWLQNTLRTAINDTKLPKVGFLDILNLCVVSECVGLESGVRSLFIHLWRLWALPCPLGSKQLAISWTSGRETSFLTKI